jgi:hypothetical protein
LSAADLCKILWDFSVVCLNAPYYGYDRICTLLQISLDEYILARDGLIAKDLIAFDGRLFQVLSLPDVPCRQPPRLLGNRQDMIRRDPATISQLITTSLGGDHHD